MWFARIIKGRAKVSMIFSPLYFISKKKDRIFIDIFAILIWKSATLFSIYHPCSSRYSEKNIAQNFIRRNLPAVRHGARYQYIPPLGGLTAKLLILRIYLRPPFVFVFVLKYFQEIARKNLYTQFYF